VIAVDTNVLVYAVVEAAPEHAAARAVLEELAGGAASWAIPWPCVHEYLRVVTHPRALAMPLTQRQARENVAALASAPGVVLLAETDRHLQVLEAVLAESGVTGNLVHDAHVAALCREHGVRELVTGDADFARFRGFEVRNPFRT
jgi:toxin-antitoxin system PIN domain toxin